MHFKRVLFPLLIALIFLINGSVQAVGVRPLVIDLQMSPGDTMPFELILTPEPVQRVVNFTLFEPRQVISGGLEYREGDPEEFPPVEWVEIPQEVEVPPGEETKVEGMVRVPFDAAGSNTVVVMVEPAVEEAETGITFRVRYAVRINIDVDRPGLRPQAQVLDFDLQADEEKQPLVQINLLNPSPLRYMASGEVTIRDEGRRLVERVLLNSPAAAQANRTETRIYPGAEVQFLGSITEPLYPGEYELRLFLRYADGRQVIQSQQVQITGDEFDQEGHMDIIRLNPEELQAQMRAGSSTSQVIQMDNRTPDNLQVNFAARPIRADYSHCIFEFINLEMRGETVLTLAPHRSGRSVLTVRAPREIEEGGYYGFLEVVALSEEGEQLEKKEIELEVLVGEDHEYKVEFLNLEVQQFADEFVFSATVQNEGRTHLAPQARIYLRNEEGAVQRTIRLNLQEDEGRILPGMTGLLVNEVRDLEPGKYTADISIEYGGEELAAAEIPLNISQNEEE